MHHCEISFQNLCYAHETVIFRTNKPKRVFRLQVRCRELDIRNFLRNCLKFFRDFLGEIVWEFFGNCFGGFFWRNVLKDFLERNFWRNFLGEMFLKDFFRRIFLGGIFGRNFLVGIFWQDFFGRNSLGGILCLHC